MVINAVMHTTVQRSLRDHVVMATDAYTYVQGHLERSINKEVSYVSTSTPASHLQHTHSD